MRRPSSFRDRRSPIELQMTPMIDCVFLLMVYFIWSASFQPLEYLLAGQLTADVTGGGGENSQDPPPAEKDFSDVVVRIRSSPTGPLWFVNDAAAPSLAELQTRLRRIAEIKRDAPVIVHPDAEVAVGDVIDVFDLARIVGFAKIQFAAAEAK
jgi:biopolymer transport protein ExbD